MTTAAAASATSVTKNCSQHRRETGGVLGMRATQQRSYTALSDARREGRTQCFAHRFSGWTGPEVCVEHQPSHPSRPKRVVICPEPATDIRKGCWRRGGDEGRWWRGTRVMEEGMMWCVEFAPPVPRAIDLRVGTCEQALSQGSPHHQCQNDKKQQRQQRCKTAWSPSRTTTNTIRPREAGG